MQHNAPPILRYTVYLTALLCMLSIGCSKDDGPGETQTPPQGSMQELRQYYNDAFVDAMLALGFNTNLGNTPPTLEGSFEISPFTLEKSSVLKDSTSIGKVYNDYLLQLSNQNNVLLTIDLEGFQGSLMDQGNGSFIVGANNSFAVYTKTTTTDSDGTYPRETAIAISGTLTSNGIENLQFYGAMLDDHGDSEDRLIENNTGRLFVDGDGLASKN